MKRVLLLLLVAGACAPRARTIAGTRVRDTDLNRQILSVCEAYRTALERKDAEALMLMASPDYWEDGGRPGGKRDYGFDGLRAVLTERLAQAEQIRFSMRYVDLQTDCSEATQDCRAYVDVLIDASYTIADARGAEQRPSFRDQNRLELVYNGTKWVFTAGM